MMTGLTKYIFLKREALELLGSIRRHILSLSSHIERELNEKLLNNVE